MVGLESGMCVLDRDSPSRLFMEGSKMTNRTRTRKTKQKLHPDWVEEKEFAVTVTVGSPLHPRFLRPSTIAIHLGQPGGKPRTVSP